MSYICYSLQLNSNFSAGNMSQTPSQSYPLYNTTFTLYRVSPLHISTTLPINTSTLQHHARRFREILVGDVLRGVRVGLETDTLSAAGTLRKVTWRLLPDEGAWDALLAEDETRWDETTVTIDSSRGIWISVEYEKSTYTAVLLKGEEDGTGDGFQHFPLLMTKMSGSLRDVLIEYLESSFDTRIAPLQLSSAQVIDSFEQYVRSVCLDEEEQELSSAERIRAIRNTVKDTQVFVGFDLPSNSGALKTLDIHLAREDLPQLITRGKALQNNTTADTPFLQALSTYVDGHLALDLTHEKVKIVRIACDAFVLGIEGKVKLSEPTGNEQQEQQYRATRKLVDGLVKIAEGGKLLSLTG